MCTIILLNHSYRVSRHRKGINMGNILVYIKNIGFFLLLVSVVCNALPENSFKKYCKLFCGLVRVALVLTPIDSVLNYNGSISDIFTKKSYSAKLDELESRLKLQEQLNIENAMVEYEAGLIDILDDIASEQGLRIISVKVDYEYDSENEMVLDRLIFKMGDWSKDSQPKDNKDIHTIDKVNKIEMGNHITDIEGLSLEDRPKVIEFVENAAKRLEIESSYIEVIWVDE